MQARALLTGIMPRLQQGFVHNPNPPKTEAVTAASPTGFMDDIQVRVEIATNTMQNLGNARMYPTYVLALRVACQQTGVDMNAFMSTDFENSRVDRGWTLRVLNLKGGRNDWRGNKRRPS